jgi:protein-S-isoprenylcysteine O-methyltransferase Ste14
MGLPNQAIRDQKFSTVSAGSIVFTLCALFFFLFSCWFCLELGDELWLWISPQEHRNKTSYQLRLLILIFIFIRALSQIVWFLLLAPYSPPIFFSILIAVFNTMFDLISIFSLLGNRLESSPGFDSFLTSVFLLGILLERLPEIDRAVFKSQKMNQGKMHIVGFYSYLVHPNYLGYLIWRSALFGLSQVWWLQLVLLFLVYDFITGDIRSQRERNIRKYGDEFKRYWDTTPKLFPKVY